MLFRTLAVLPLLLALPAAAQQAVPPARPAAAAVPRPLLQPATPREAAIKGHIQFLASDALRGREAGTRDFDVAAEYVASQFLAIGLKPGGTDGSWFQPVRLATYRASEKGSMTLTRGKTEVPMVFGTDFINNAVPGTPDFSVSGQVVFVGYGIVYPEGRRDDYRGLDVRGKVVALLPGVPKGLPNEVEAHFGDDDMKARVAQDRGAKAVIVLESAANRAEYPFAAIAPYWNYQRTTWAAPDGRAFSAAAGAPPIAYVSWAGAEKLFEGARIRWKDVLEAESKGNRIPTAQLPVTLAATTRTSVRTTESRNVIGILEGTDPTLRGEYIVLSAHLDHVGVGEAVNGDRIYNGAMDNALGTAMIVETARAFQASGRRPRRSLLFISLTAEEKGLIGSEFFANHPTVPRDKLVANINLDMPILTYPLQDLVVLGAERSTMGPVMTRVAAANGLKVVPDPSPEEMFFVRSDHYSFVKSGIPAVSIDSGPGGEGDRAQKDFLAKHYHKPSDQIDLPFHWPSTVRFLDVTYGLARELGDADQRPAWKKGDFFGVQFGGFGAQ